ncbi:MAG: MBL fold metallo-hydrolase [Hydrogenophaga sp.]|uniref:MBL fold metallo-hydrolase n=1 Tax=Hydrogenophaga sp. TaxID=1904254 RepID=UPI002731A65A|nr:MBL fold metallo-hydrolase [Hydrogenophaga sp.]MDP2408147.1 MBL fold metallo-hydrolase [Hydrogenophaga sp.]MDZ4174029.1 MBL fold metallo-hydrolase [Hydrogenophaga sp.]
MTEAPSVADALEAVGVVVFERGWLSANNTLIRGDGPMALVDSGYCSHAHQTLSLVDSALGDARLDLLLNTHLHSDHCGGNAALQEAYPKLVTLIPPGQADNVANWDPVALTYAPTGQKCPPFCHQGLLLPGEELQLGSWRWEIHGAKGHDPHSIILFQPDHRVLISADALWQNGFGVVFPELEGQAAFEEVGETLDLIEGLNPRTVIPGHGSVFQDVGPAITRARSRLDQFIRAPEKHHRHAIKVLIKFRLLEWQTIEHVELLTWARNTPYLSNSMPIDSDQEQKEWLHRLLTELERSHALRLEGNLVVNA